MEVADPLEGSFGVIVKLEIKEEPENEDYFIHCTPDLHLDFVEEPKSEEAFTLNSTGVIKNPKTGLMVCVHCLQELRSDGVSEHMTNTHNYKRISLMCHNCQETFSERSDLRQHRRQCQPPRHKRQSFKQILQEVDATLEKLDSSDETTCPICSQELPKCRLKEHLTAEHSGPKLEFICDVCKSSFKLKMTLKEHIKLVHEAVECSVECGQCGLRFRSRKYLGNHARNVHPVGGQTHACAACGKRFKSKLCLHQHTKCVHPPAGAAARCPRARCRKLFKSRANLQQHFRITRHGDPRHSD